MKQHYLVSVFGETDSYFDVELTEEEIKSVESFLDLMMESISSWDALSVNFAKID